MVLTGGSHGVAIHELVQSRVKASRSKELESPFRGRTFDNDKEKEAVWGVLKDDAVINESETETRAFKRKAAQLKKMNESQKI